MKLNLKLTLLAVLFSLLCNSQNELKKWYFGTFAGLDFITSPPTVLTNGQLWTAEGCSSISDASGNLLFYTNGKRIYNANHVLMANGNALTADESATQTGLIIKKPGSQNIYYVFSLDAQGGANGLRYSIVDMSLAAGLGSVTALDVLLYTPSTEKLAATSHCNGTDVWLVSHENNSNVFKTYLVSAAGISANAISSSVGAVTTVSTSQGQMKFSSNGRKLGLACFNGNIELYDFDPATGIVSNPLVLTTVSYGYGCEFSPDGGKFYISRLPPSGAMNGAQLLQWDLCAGSNAAIIASQYSISVPSGGSAEFSHGGMQLGPDGKIYVAASYEQSLHVIASPNLAGGACAYTHLGLSIAPRYVGFTLPSFVVYHSTATQTTSPFTWTASCQTVSFSAPPIVTGTTTSGCFTLQSGPSSLLWLFGDPGAASTASSSLTNPLYAYSNVGTYNAKLVLKYPCYSDTLTVPVTVTSTVSLIDVSGKTEICAGESAALIATGCTSYSWNGSPGGAIMTFTPGTTTNYSISGAGTSSVCPVTSTVVTIIVNKCLGIEENQKLNTAVYPNPFDKTVTIASKEPGEIIFYNSSGIEVLSLMIEAGTQQVDCRSLPAGIYLLYLHSENDCQRMRLVKSEL